RRRLGVVRRPRRPADRRRLGELGTSCGGRRLTGRRPSAEHPRGSGRLCNQTLEPIKPDPVASLTVTTLVDNVADLLLLDQGPAKRPSIDMLAYPDAPARFIEGGRTGATLRAEHGFSCLVTIGKAGRTTRVLFDTGISPD